MYGFWVKGYIGDGLWGRGVSLCMGEWEKNIVLVGEVFFEYFCGGMYWL